MNPFTKAVIRDYLTTWEGPAATARSWVLAYRDRERAEVAFAEQLHDDFHRWWPPTGQPEAALVDVFLAEGFLRVNWRHVARYLLNRFCPELPDAAREGVQFSAN